VSEEKIFLARLKLYVTLETHIENLSLRQNVLIHLTAILEF
jgi:hypothetical protein